MYELQFLNVVRIVETKAQRDKLISEGYVEIKKEVKKKQSRKGKE